MTLAALFIVLMVNRKKLFCFYYIYIITNKIGYGLFDQKLAIGFT